MRTRAKLLKRRAGVAAPLFSIYSEKSIGIGEIPDLKLLIDWCKAAGISVIQLLPLNDTGFLFRPYDAESSLALDPMYLSISDLVSVEIRPFAKEIAILRNRFPAGRGRVDYGIKRAKLDLLWKIFEKTKPIQNRAFQLYCRAHESWLKPYALFRVIKEKTAGQSWENWPAALKNAEERVIRSSFISHCEERSDEAISEIASPFGLAMTGEGPRIEFHAWLQWQLFEQFRRVKQYAGRKGVLLMGDLPFLVARDSVDVWANPQYFKLDLAAGAPPDLYFAKGQRWGMPPYDWERVARDGYRYLAQKLQYAENFYHLLRMDHFVGLFRIWTIPVTEPLENGGLKGRFDPPDETIWEDHGRRILQAILEKTRLLPCAEDLGVIPACSNRVLEEFGILGTDVQRWTRDWEKTLDFKPPESYRKNSMAVISTHDMAPFRAWWEGEAPREDQEKFWKYVGMRSASRGKCSVALTEKALEKISSARSLFSIQLLQDWLSIGPLAKGDPSELRINRPGIVSERNWSFVIPIALEKMLKLKINKLIRTINRESGRIPL